MAKELKARGENPDVARYFTGYGVRPGGHAEDRDVQYWIDILERDGALGKGQIQVTHVYTTPSEVCDDERNRYPPRRSVRAAYA